MFMKQLPLPIRGPTGFDSNLILGLRFQERTAVFQDDTLHGCHYSLSR